MTQPDPLSALWAADEPPARDTAFTAAVLARAVERREPRRADWPRRLLTGLGIAGALAGSALMAPADPSAMAVIGAALAWAIWVGGRLFSPA